MRRLWDFHGGVHPPENKEQSGRSPIRQPRLPDLLTVPLHQPTGEPCRALVEPGVRVMKGERIAAAQDHLQVSVHAPTSGWVKAICRYPVPHPSGLEAWCVLIEPDGEERWTELHPCADYRSAEPAELLRRIREAGIAGMGGAGFPTHIKLRPPAEDRIRTLILNGAECEPYITADQLLMQERAAEVVAGAQIMAHILDASECLIAVEDNKPEAIAAMRKAVGDTTLEVEMEVVAIPTRYPSGGEKQLVEILTGSQVPHDGIPADIGIVCQNVATAAAVYRAINLGEPLISRITTVTGEAIHSPGNFDTLVGTPIEHLLSEAGHNAAATQRLVMGGPMMGFALDSKSMPIIKTSNCIIAATATEFPAPPPAQACIRCGMCEQVCPMELLPQQLYWFARSGEHDKAEQANLFDCIECGACSYVCPSTIPLVQHYRNTKSDIRHQQAERLKADHARKRFEARQQRLEQEQAEKEARRRARAEASAQTQSQPQQSQAPDRQAEEVASSARSSSSKSAAVQAALARAQAKRAGATADAESLQKNLARSRDNLAKMRAALDEARASDPDKVEKLQEAVAKNEARVRAAESALAQARPGPDPQASPVVDAGSVANEPSGRPGSRPTE